MRYKFHNENSRKGVVHFIYDEYDSESAFEIGRKLGLNEMTLLSWISTWRACDKRHGERGVYGRVS